MQFGDDGVVETEPSSTPATSEAVELRRVPVKANSPAPVFHPLAYRAVVADWPTEWRERWGRRANELEEKGLLWRDAEALAFVEVWNERRQQAGATAAQVVEPEVSEATTPNVEGV